jgi:hypothetical protein
MLAHKLYINKGFQAGNAIKWGWGLGRGGKKFMI